MTVPLQPLTPLPPAPQVQLIPPKPVDPFAGMKGVRSEEVYATDRIKMAILGKPGVGKSWLAATAPKPIRYYDFDCRKESLEGKPGLFILTNPTMTDVETDLSMMKAAVVKAKQTKTTAVLPATIVFDSVTYMNRAMEDEIFRQQPGLCRLIKVGSSISMKIRSGWDTINGIQRYIEYLIAELEGLGVNFIFVFHEKDEKDRTESTAAESKYTGLVTTDPQYLQNSLSLFNEVYRITVDASKPNQINYNVTCRPTLDVLAKTTLLVDTVEKPDIMDMIAKHKANRAALPQNALAK